MYLVVLGRTRLLFSSLSDVRRCDAVRWLGRCHAVRHGQAGGIGIHLSLSESEVGGAGRGRGTGGDELDGSEEGRCV